MMSSVYSQVSIEKAWPALLRRMVDTVRARNLFQAGDRLLVAVSGGPDSVALLSLLHELAPDWNLSLSTIHFNYGLRGAESEEDAQFVTQLCERLNVPLTIQRVRLGSCGSSRLGGSLQERAREVRYEKMRRLYSELGAHKVALGHTMDDQAETVLLRMLRGTGLSGLSGIPYVREGLFVRPLLDVDRAGILSYLAARQLEFRLDSSNATPMYCRNRVRSELLPVAKRLSPEVVSILCRQAETLRADEEYLQQCVREHWVRVTEREDGDVIVRRSALLALPLALQRRMIRAVAQLIHETHMAPSFRTVAGILERVVLGRSGNRMSLRGLQVVREFDRIRFRRGPTPKSHGVVVQSMVRSPETSGELSLSIPSSVSWPWTEQRVEVSLLEASSVKGLLSNIATKQTAFFDADRFTLRLSLRQWRPGDTFQPLGMKGRRKKLQDYFTDVKLPRSQRQRVPLLTAPEGILWVGGYRVDQRFAPRPSTRRYLVATITNDVDEGGKD
ncbi:MAG: tRNA lysidine(34) synthetase TilS [Nitrospiraceae bacterium]